MNSRREFLQKLTASSLIFPLSLKTNPGCRCAPPGATLLARLQRAGTQWSARVSFAAKSSKLRRQDAVILRLPQLKFLARKNDARDGKARERIQDVFEEDQAVE
jgi:hypothetical protein